MKNQRIIFSIISMLLISAFLFNLTACSSIPTAKAADNLMSGVKANTTDGKTADDTFISSFADFSVNLFKKSEKTGENSLVSPLSVMLALAMTANGANGKTAEEMATALFGDISIEEMNKYLYSFVRSLNSDDGFKMKTANSIWIKKDDRLSVNKDFLQTNADFFSAQIYSSDFDDKTLKDINNWVSESTDSMIDKIIEEINPKEIMYLINALTFEAEWNVQYDIDADVFKDTFKSADLTENKVDMMHSSEGIYIKQDNATGFIKDYKGSKYAFATFLPNEDVSIDEYISSLTGEKITDSIKNAQETGVIAVLPKFTYKYDVTLNNALKSMGISDAFDIGKADFSKLGTFENGNIYIGQVIHKTYISVDTFGTKAGAVTGIALNGATAEDTRPIVNLNRPFVYAIIDKETSLPLFIGTLENMK